jgi:hypothetical protein
MPRHKFTSDEEELKYRLRNIMRCMDKQEVIGVKAAIALTAAVAFASVCKIALDPLVGEIMRRLPQVSNAKVTAPAGTIPEPALSKEKDPLTVPPPTDMFDGLD